MQKSGRVALLEYDTSLLPDGEPQCLRPCAALVKSCNKEAAGAAFHHRALIQAGILPYEEDSSTSESDISDDASVDTETDEVSTEDLEEPLSGARWRKAKKPKHKVKKVEVDYYKLLGLEQERWMATEEQISKAYRKVCLKMHPDKFATRGEEEIANAEEEFKKIQDAYEVLSNENSRRLYDSTDAFDDSIPIECDPADFFKVYGPAFRRYSRWSVEKNVPDLGTMETSWETVSSFYDFWFSFKSWRQFPHPDEEDPAFAMGREHKRWIERQNMKLREKAKKDESKRIRDLVQSAHRLDPRVTIRREAENKARNEKKKEKARAKREAEETEREEEERQQALLREQEEARRLQEEEERRNREIEKRALKEQRKRLRDLCTKDDVWLIDRDALYDLCQKLEKEKLEKLCDYLENEKNMDTSKKVLKNTVEVLWKRDKEEEERKAKEREEARIAFESKQKREKKKKVEMMTEWSEEELRMLDKALQKFPQGTRRRWEQVTDYIRTRSLEEVLIMVKEQQGASRKRFEAQQNWRAPQKQREIGTAPTKAEESFTDVQIERDSNPSDGDVVQSVVSGTWTKDQELALVKAIKAVRKEEPDRWDRIAEQVSGKTKAECFKRFKELRESFRAQKETA